MARGAESAPPRAFRSTLCLGPNRVNQEAEVLGQDITPEGIRIIQRHFDTILNITNPTNLKKLCSQLSTFNFYAKYMKNLEAVLRHGESIQRTFKTSKKVPVTLKKEASNVVDTKKNKVT